MSHSRDGPGVTAPLQTNIVPLTGVWNTPPPIIPFPPLTGGHLKPVSRIFRIFLAWPPLQSLAVKKNYFFAQILGDEKLLK